MAASCTPAQFIRDNLVIETVAPGLRLYCAHPGSGLWRLRLQASGDCDPAPYWAYPWAGGAALAVFILENTDDFAGRTVFDMGCGCGIAAIAAAMASAHQVTAVDIDPYAVAATALNAELNGVAVDTCLEDMLDGPAPAADIILAGDLFYDETVARRSFAFLTRCAATGARVLIGDPHRTHLPKSALRMLREYSVPDVGSARSLRTTPAAVFTIAES